MSQIHIGLDFDNTIVLYDEIFYRFALEKGYISTKIKKSKKDVRNELIRQNKEYLFTEMQGFIYGKAIENAPIQKGFLNSLKKLSKLNYKISIVSHKTKYPIRGYKYNLHQSALNWLKKNNILNNNDLKIYEKDVFFETTEEKKIRRIEKIRCTHYVDDLEKILVRLNNKIKKIHFINMYEKQENINLNFYYLRNWDYFEELIKKINYY